MPTLSRASLALPALVLLAGCRPAAPLPETLNAHDPVRIQAQMRKVADWMMAHRMETPGGQHGDAEWTIAAWYTGVMALYERDRDPRDLAQLMSLGPATGWKVGPRPFFGDDQAIAQIHLDLYRKIKQDPAYIADFRKVVDAQLAAPDPGLGPHRSAISFKGAWSWCDCLYMAPPAWARLALVTGDRRYLDAMDVKFWKTYDFLFDKEEGLFYRDASYFTRKEANGRKVFWSRGNGWVLGGLVRILEVMPKDYPSRPRYEALFRQMATRVKDLQRPDGLWRASLLDPGSYPGGETSGTAFFAYAFAWGLNEGLLDRATFEPTTRRAWAALDSAIQADGRLGWAQPIGQDPKQVRASDTEVYAVGAFLLAGVEMRRFLSPVTR